jgi:glycogen synthase
MSTMPGAALVLLGDGPERADLLALATDLRLDDRVHLPGSVPRGSVPAHLAHADVAVMPSRYEEAGRGIVEAMAAGTPVVASGVGGIPAIVRAGVNGLLVPPDDPAALASAIDRVISQPTFARTLVAQGRVTASTHEIDRLVDHVMHTYDFLVRSGPREIVHRTRQVVEDAVAE